jgi:hypothetical protein
VDPEERREGIQEEGRGQGGQSTGLAGGGHDGPCLGETVLLVRLGPMWEVRLLIRSRP